MKTVLLLRLVTITKQRVTDFLGHDLCKEAKKFCPKIDFKGNEPQDMLQMSTVLHQPIGIFP